MHRTPRTTIHRMVVVLGVLFFVGLTMALAFRVEGGRWFMVQTPSMGTEAPRGSLLLTKPVAQADVQAGDFITFKNPESGQVYSHRAVEITAEGIKTKGDVNSVPDAWTITDKQLIGRVIADVPAAGWLIKAIPPIGLGFCLVFMLTIPARHHRKMSYRMAGYSLIVSLVGFLMKPWVGLGTLGQRVSADNENKLMIDLISTGLLPITVGPKDGVQSEKLVNGATTTAVFDVIPGGDEYLVSSHLALNIWWWLGIVAVCLIPLFWTLIFGVTPLPVEDEEALVDEDRVILV